MFEIDKNTKIVFYGYSKFDTVRAKYQEMNGLGYQILGYLDQKADEIVPCIGEVCWTMEEFPYSEEMRKDIVVILLLQNGRLHEKVVEDLHRIGFEKVLFLPEKADTMSKNCMLQKYNSFMRSEYTSLYSIPDWNDIFEEDAVTNTEFLIQGEKNCTVFVPIELLFTYALEDGGEENICFANIYQELFAVLEGKTSVCNNYCEFMGADTELSKTKLLSDRHLLYCMWEYYRQYNVRYFIEAAPIVSWNSKGYFTIVDGHHRAFYLMSKGYKEIPVSMTNEDYNRWCRNVWKNDYVELKSRCIPVPQPAFLHEEYIFTEHWWKVIRYLYKVGHNHACRLVEIDDYMGYYAGTFQRIVKGGAIVILEDEHEILLCKNMQEYMHQIFPIMKRNEVDFQEGDIIYLKYRGDEKQFMEFINQTYVQNIIIDLPAKGHEKLLEQITEKFLGKYRYLCRYYREKEHLICALERKMIKWQK